MALEGIGVALAAIVTVKPIISFVDEVIKTDRTFASEVTFLRLRFTAEFHKLSELEVALFNKDKVGNSKSIYEQMPAEIQRDIMFMFGELYDLFDRYRLMREKYNVPQLQKSGEQFDAFMDSNLRVTTTFQIGQEEDAEAIRQRSALFVQQFRMEKKEQLKANRSRMRRISWIFQGSGSLKEIVEDFEKWHKLLKKMLEDVWWTMLPSPRLVARIETNSYVISSGLVDDAEARKTILVGREGEYLSAVFAAIEVPKERFTQSKLFAHGSKAFGTLALSSTQSIAIDISTVLVEFKGFNSTSDHRGVDATSLKRIQLLAALLSSKTVENAPCLPHCIAVFKDRSQDRCGFAYAVPPGLHTDACKTLDDAFESKKTRPSLEKRLALAYQLAATLQKIHSLGWVHKSIRSENILVFESTAPTTNGSRQLRTFDTAYDSRLLPLLTGFECSRPTDEFSSIRTDMDIMSNLYRHPHRWNQPARRFAKQHDYYALGVVLLELGLWIRIDKLDSSKGRKPIMDEAMCADGRGPELVKSRLLKHTKQRLGFYTGTKYQKVVQTCLSGNWEGVPEEYAQVTFAKEVTDVLRDLIEDDELDVLQ